MTERMSDEEIAKIEKQHHGFATVTVCKLTAALKAERARVVELENPNPLVEIRVSPTEVYDPDGATWKQRAYAAEAKLAAEMASVHRLAAKELELEATLARVKGLIPKWKEGDFNLPDYTRGKIDGRHECAKQLLAVLDKATPAVSTPPEPPA